MFEKRRRAFRERVNKSSIVMVPGAYDALTAMLVEQAGFEAVYLTGAGISYSLLGKPDLGLVTASEMVSRAYYICEAVQIPVIADGDTGYGNALNVMRTVKDYERAGVAAIQLEDQVFPKKCGHLTNKSVISTDEMVGKIRAATDARVDENLLIIARTDARATHGLEEAIERAQRYAEAGADVIFVEAPESVDELRNIAQEVKKPLVANMVEKGKTPFLSAKELEQIGYRIVIYPNSVTRFIVKAAQELYTELKRNGSTRELVHRMLSFDQINNLLNIKQFLEAEKRYSKGSTEE